MIIDDDDSFGGFENNFIKINQVILCLLLFLSHSHYHPNTVVDFHHSIESEIYDTAYFFYYFIGCSYMWGIKKIVTTDVNHNHIISETICIYATDCEQKGISTTYSCVYEWMFLLYKYCDGYRAVEEEEMRFYFACGCNLEMKLINIIEWLIFSRNWTNTNGMLFDILQLYFGFLDVELKIQQTCLQRPIIFE